MAHQPLKIGVAGLGRIGWSFHCRKLAEHGDFWLSAVADTDPARCREAEAAFGCRTYPDFDSMVEKAGLDAVVIATPTHMHEKMALKAFDAGLHALLEKPMASSFEEACRIAEAARSGEKVLTVYQPHRLAAYFRQLLALAGDGRIGRICGVQRGVFKYARRNDWQAIKDYAGGMLNNYGAHYLDQLLQLTGYDIKRVFCHLQLVASLGDADDVVKVVIETAGGILGECTINQASAVRPYEFIVWGACGALYYADGKFRLRYFDPDKLPAKELDAGLASKNREYPSDTIEWQEETAAVDPALQVDVFADFARAIREGEPPAVPPDQTLAVMKLISRCFADAGGVHLMRQDGAAASGTA